MLSTTTRPIFCFCCGKSLYYFEDLRHVPEFVIELRDPKKAIELNQQIVKYFIHQECWNTLLTYSDHIWKLSNDIKNIDTE